MSPLSLADVEAMIKLLSTVGDPTVDIPLDKRKRSLMQGIAELIDADAWLWILAQENPDLPGDAAPLGIVDGGWASEQQRTDLFRIIVNPELSRSIALAFQDSVINQQPMTLSRDLILSDEEWQSRPIAEEWSVTGLDHFLASVYPLSKYVLSNVGMHRRQGKPPFGIRERAIVHVMLQQIDWLHREGSSFPASAARVVELSPRERQVVLLLIGGDSRKQVALKLNLSQHTVADYLKAIYRKLSVNSRAELLAKFIPSGK